MSHDVFISYSDKDRGSVKAICAFLEQHGIRCWVAYRDIEAGADWGGAIVQAVKSCQLMVLVFSSHANESKEIDKEITLAAKNGKPILAFKLVDEPYVESKEYHLVNRHWIDAFPNMESSFGKLERDVRALIGLIPEAKGVASTRQKIIAPPSGVAEPWPDHGIPWNPKIKYGVFVDPRDGHKYRTVKIGKQTWLSENLAFKASGSWVYENKPENEAKYGRLYDWETAKKAVPPGWHLPTDKEWMELEVAVGMSAAKTKETDWRNTNDEGTKLKSTKGWSTEVGLDQYGFRVLPAGSRDADGSFGSLGDLAFFWSASPEGSSYAWGRYFNHGDGDVGRVWYYRSNGRSVRLLED